MIEKLNSLYQWNDKFFKTLKALSLCIKCENNGWNILCH